MKVFYFLTDNFQPKRLKDHAHTYRLTWRGNIPHFMHLFAFASVTNLNASLPQAQLDSNQQMQESKSCVLPFDYEPKMGDETPAFK